MPDILPKISKWTARQTIKVRGVSIYIASRLLIDFDDVDKCLSFVNIIASFQSFFSFLRWYSIFDEVCTKNKAAQQINNQSFNSIHITKQHLLKRKTAEWN